MTLEKGLVPSATPRQCLGQSRESLRAHLVPVTWISSAQEEISHCCELFTASLVVHLSALSNLQFFPCSFFRVLSSAEAAEVIYHSWHSVTSHIQIYDALIYMTWGAHISCTGLVLQLYARLGVNLHNMKVIVNN